MQLPKGLTWRQGAFWIAAAGVVAAAGAGLFVVSGVYNVAATAPHFLITERVITLALRRSVAVRSSGRDVPDLTGDGLVRLGANHFQIGCAPCHGSPATSADAVVRRMYPVPPRLRDVAQKWSTEELFWIVKHGIKMTGMPAWAGDDRDDEVWPVVAFLERLPALEGEQYRSLTQDAPADRAAGRPGSAADAVDQALVGYCNACHGGPDSPPAHGIVPSLHGQKAAYLRRAMVEYRDNQRQSGIMEAVAGRLDDGEIAALAAHYSRNDLDTSTPDGPAADPASVQRGLQLVERGASEGQIPACLACHGRQQSSQFPVLAGLSAHYIENQLDLFQRGVRDQTGYGAIMATIASRLSRQQMQDAAAYLSTIPAPRSAVPGDR